MEQALSYLWIAPLLWFTWDRNTMKRSLDEAKERLTKVEAKSVGLHQDMKDHKRMLEKIVESTTEIQTSIAYWKGKSEQA